MGFFLGIDLGTSYFKAGLFDEKGNLKGMGRQVVKKIIKNNITCELPVPVFWEILRECVREALQSAYITSQDVRTISYSSQANSFILLDSHNKPLTPLILWPDKRAESIEFSDELWQHRSDFIETTGLGIVPGPEFCIAKLSWFQKKHPDIWKQVASIMSISDYLTFELTGQKVSDYSTASLTGLLNTSQYQWWDKSLELFNLRQTCLPTLLRVGTKLGPLTAKGAQHLGLLQETSFCLGGLDHHIAAIGAGIIRSHHISESTGTVLACVNYQESYLTQANCCVAAGLDDNHHFKMAFDENGATSLDWYQKEFAPELTVAELLQKAALIEPGCEGLKAKPCAYKFSAFNGFENVKPYHGHGHFVRALLESTAFSLSTIVAVLSKSSQSDGIISTGGGAQSSLWINIKANLLGSNFYIPECSETACLGAAMLGAISSGETGSMNETMENWVKIKEIIKPDPLNMQLYQKWVQSKKTLFKSDHS